MHRTDLSTGQDGPRRRARTGPVGGPGQSCRATDPGTRTGRDMQACRSWFIVARGGLHDRIRTASIVFSTRLFAPSMLQSLLHRPLFPLSRSRSSHSSSRDVRKRDMSITTGEHKATKPHNADMYIPFNGVRLQLLPFPASGRFNRDSDHRAAKYKNRH